MTTATTELDARCSDPGAQPTSWENTLQAIKQAEIFWISTLRADGRPHVTPLVAVWLDDALHFSTGASEEKALGHVHDVKPARGTVRRAGRGRPGLCRHSPASAAAPGSRSPRMRHRRRRRRGTGSRV